MELSNDLPPTRQPHLKRLWQQAGVEYAILKRDVEDVKVELKKIGKQEYRGWRALADHTPAAINSTVVAMRRRGDFHIFQWVFNM